MPEIVEHATLVVISFKQLQDSSARLCFGRFDSCRKNLFHFMQVDSEIKGRPPVPVAIHSLAF